MGFADDIRKFKEKALKAASDNTSKIAADFFRTNVMLSPTPNGKGGYSVGTIKNNWYASVGSPDMSYSGSVDANGSSSLSSINATISSQPFLGRDNTVYLSNSTPWAQRADKVGWKKNDSTNDTGWEWTGKIGAYLFTSTSLQTILNKYS